MGKTDTKQSLDKCKLATKTYYKEKYRIWPRVFDTKKNILLQRNTAQTW